MAHRFVDAIAAGSRVFDVLGNGRTTLPAGAVVSGGFTVTDTGCSITGGSLYVAATTDIGTVYFHAASQTFSSTLMHVHADEAPGNGFFLQELDSGGTDMFTVRVFALPHRIRGM